MLDRYIQFVLRNRWLVLAFATLLMIMMAAGGGFIKVENNYRILFNEDDPRLIALDRLEQTYSESNTALIAVSPKEGGSVFSRETLGAIIDLTDALWQTPHTFRVDSLTNHLYSRADGEELIVSPLVEYVDNQSDEDLAGIRDIALAEREIVGSLVSADGRTSGLIVHFALPEDSQEEIKEATDFLHSVLDQQREAHPELGYYVTGYVIVNQAMGEATEDDFSTLVPIVFLVVAVLAALFLRSLLGAVVVITVLVFTVLSTMGLVGWIGMTLSPVSSGTPVVVIVIGVATSIHIASNALLAMKEGKDRNAAVAESLRLNVWPVFLTSLTTIIGFLSLNSSDSPPFHDLGNAVAMGIVCTFIYAMTLLPALLLILPLRIRVGQLQELIFFERLADLVIVRKRLVTISSLLVIAALVAGIPRIELGDNLTHFFDRSYQVRIDSDFIAENLTGLDKLEYSLPSGQERGITDPEYLRKVDAFAEWFRMQPETTHVQAFSDVMKRLNKNMNGDDPSFYRLPEAQDLAAQYLLLYEFSLPMGRDLNDRIDVSKSATRMTVTIGDATSGELRAVDDRAREWLRANIPEFTQGATGVNLIVAHLTQRNIYSMLYGTAIALLLVSLILVGVFRNVRIGLVSLLPNFIPALMTFGLWGHLVGQIGVVSSVVLAIVFGIVVDDTIHFLTKYLRGRRNGLGSPDAVRYAFRTVGHALWTTTVILAAGFLVFLASGFELTWVLGVLVSITVVFALAADFLLLPNLLIATDRSDSRS